MLCLIREAYWKANIAYSEFYITDVFWPDFDENELDKAILSFNKRDRRYGGLNVK